jgi:hypothetical protein
MKPSTKKVKELQQELASTRIARFLARRANDADEIILFTGREKAIIRAIGKINPEGQASPADSINASESEDDMRKQAQIEADLQKIRQVITNGQSELLKLKEAEDAAQKQWQEELLDLGKSEMPETLKAIHARQEDLTATRAAAERKQKDLTLELNECQMAIRLKGRDEFHADFWGKLENLKESLGELASKFAELETVIRNANEKGIGEGITMDFDISLRKFSSLKAALFSELGKAKSGLDSILANKPK